MKNLLLWDLVPRMAALEQPAFEEFEEELRDTLICWFHQWGLADDEVMEQLPRCILALAFLVVDRQTEFGPLNIETWLRVRARNLVVPHYRQEEERSQAGHPHGPRPPDETGLLTNWAYAGRLTY